MKILNKSLRRIYAQAGFCELCHLYCLKREGHHIRAKGMGGQGVLDVRINLISTGAAIKLPDGRTRFSCNCHRLIHAGKTPIARCLEIVALREKVRVEEIIEVLDWMRRLAKPSPADLERGLAELTPAGRMLAERELREAEETLSRRKAKPLVDAKRSK